MYDLGALFMRGGDARAFFKNAPGGGDWVDGLCDQIVAEVTEKRTVALIVEKAGAYRAHHCKTQGGRVQLNIQWTKARGWSCYTCSTLEEALDQMWSQQNMVTNLGGNAK